MKMSDLPRQVEKAINRVKFSDSEAYYEDAGSFILFTIGGDRSCALACGEGSKAQNHIFEQITQHASKTLEGHMNNYALGMQLGKALSLLNPNDELMEATSDAFRAALSDSDGYEMIENMIGDVIKEITEKLEC